MGLLSFLISLIAISFRGLGDRRSKVFREKYSRIGDFCALCPEVCFVALTATATLVVEKEVAKQLQMSPYKVIRRSPEKCNIRYAIVVKFQSSLLFRGASQFLWSH